MRCQLLPGPLEHHLTFGGLCKSLWRRGFLGSRFGGIFACGGIFGRCEAGDIHS